MGSRANTARLHLWFPDIFGFKGGIQVYSAFLLEALQKCWPDGEFTVFLKHDYKDLSKGLKEKESSSPHFRFVGSWPLPLRTSAFATQIFSSAMREQPDLIITSHLNFTPAAYWLKRLRGVPYWTIAHGVEAWDVQRPIVRKSLHNADRILSVSNYTRNRLLTEQNIDPLRISLLPNTFDAERFRIGPKPLYLLQRYGLLSTQPIILTVARLVASEQYKGYASILRAMPNIIEHIPNVHYLIAGKGDDRQHIEALISELGLRSQVTLTGFVPDEELCDHYNLCDVFAMPSKREGFGIVYLEALACGRPTLAGNKDGATDALCNGALGALVDPDDINAIADILVQILKGDFSHPIIYKPEALREKVIATYGFDRFTKTASAYIDEFFQSRSASESGNTL